MTTGFKINHAKDNAANYSIATNMTTKIGAYNVAEDNAAMGLDLISTAEGTLSQIEDKLQRLRALAEQAANGTYGEQSLNAINAEANALVDEIERIYNNSEYNGINLMKGRVVGTEESKFIKDIDRRDTSKMAKFASVEEDVRLESGTYSISTADELEKLAKMTNNGLIGADTEFVLANNIDLQEWCANNSGTGGWIPIGNTTNSFNGVFDGNGYVIMNLTLDTTSSFNGLFGYTYGANVTNLGIQDADIIGNGFCGALVGQAKLSEIDNCYSTGSINNTGNYTGGLMGDISESSKVFNCYSECYVKSTGNYTGGLSGVAEYYVKINNSYSTGIIEGYQYTAGFVGFAYGNIEITNCYSTGDVSGNYYTAGFVGTFALNSYMNNCYTTSNVNSNSGSAFIYSLKKYNSSGEKTVISNCQVLSESVNVQSIWVNSCSQPLEENVIYENCSYNSFYDTNSIPWQKVIYPSVSFNNIITCDDTKPLEITNNALITHRDKNITMQVGVNNNDSSRIGVEVGYDIGSISTLRRIGTGSGNCLSILDNLLSQVTSKQTEYGAVQNRLESALDEILTQYENLVSSRSTIRDADMAEVSSHYIQQQILQQASATLLATANQSPSIALQLI